MSARICHMSSVHPPNDIRIFRKQCRSLAANHFDVHFVVPQDNNDEEDGVKRWGIPTRTGRIRRMTRSVYDAFKKAADLNADLYHFHDPELLPAGFALKARGARVIFDSHEDLPRQILSKSWIHPLLRRPLAWSSELAENLGLRALDAVVGATPHIAQRFSDLGLDAVAINNYPLLGELDVLETDWASKKRQICFVGGISTIRGIYEMIEASEISGVPLKLGGPFLPATLQNEVINSPGSTNTEYLGFLDRPAIAHLLSKSIAGVVVFSAQPNHISAQPNKLFEYLAGGIPVIASHFPLWRELVEGEEVGICVDPANPSEIAKAVEYLAGNLDVAEAMGHRGQTLVRERCNWNTEERTLIALYERILACKS